MDPNLSAPQEPQTDQLQPVAAPRGLKIAVIVMGVVLIVGFITVFVTIGYRIANPRVAAPAASGAEAIYDTSLSIPRGGEISQLQAAEDRALLTVTGANGVQTLIVLDTAKGRVIGRFTLNQE